MSIYRESEFLSQGKEYRIMENNSYYEDKTSDKGRIVISEYVFVQIANDVLSELREEKKIAFSLEYGKKKGYIRAEITKSNKVTISVGIFLPVGQDTKVLCDIQKEIYDEVFEATEISSLKVDRILLGCYPVK